MSFFQFELHFPEGMGSRGMFTEINVALVAAVGSMFAKFLYYYVLSQHRLVVEMTQN